MEVTVQRPPVPAPSVILTLTPTEFTDLLACVEIAIRELTAEIETKRERWTIDRIGLHQSLLAAAESAGL